MISPYLYSTPWPANADELAAGTPSQLLAVETEPPLDRDAAMWQRRVRQVERRLAETSSQLNVHRERYSAECGVRLRYELENRNLVKRVSQLERLNATLAAECDRLQKGESK